MSDQIAEVIAKQAPAAGTGVRSRMALMAPDGTKTWVIEIDAATSDLTIRKLVAGSSGARDTSVPMISLNLDDIDALSLTNSIAKFRLFQWVGDDCLTHYQAAILMTVPETYTP